MNAEEIAHNTISATKKSQLRDCGCGAMLQGNLRHTSIVWRGLFFMFGLIALGMGILGVILPILPTTPFLLLAAICFTRSSNKMYAWLHTNKLFGEYLLRYRNKLGIPLRVKVITLTLLWITMISSIVYLTSTSRLWLQLTLLAIATGVSIHVLRIKTYKD